MTTHLPPLRVLVVDDELPVRMLLTRILRGWGYQVWHVGSADEALGVMRLDPADIVICDIRMPGHGGLWLAHEVHAHWPHTPIIMATGAVDAEVVQASRRNGAIAYVTKPLVRYYLKEAVENAALQCRRGTDAAGRNQASDSRSRAAFTGSLPVGTP